MIIFDLDCLADDSHRRHFIDPKHPKNLEITNRCLLTIDKNGGCESNHQINNFIPDYKAYYEACDKDEQIDFVASVFQDLSDKCREIEVWSSRCESVRKKTENWLWDRCLNDYGVKMRPIDDNRPAEELFKRWVDERIDDMGNQLISDIDFAFSSNPEVIAIFRRLGIFVFDCKQGD